MFLQVAKGYQLSISSYAYHSLAHHIDERIVLTWFDRVPIEYAENHLGDLPEQSVSVRTKKSYNRTSYVLRCFSRFPPLLSWSRYRKRPTAASSNGWYLDMAAFEPIC